jgi:hypothetical protein
MNEFSAEWLDLREPVDETGRAADLVDMLSSHLASRLAPHLSSRLSSRLPSRLPSRLSSRLSPPFDAHRPLRIVDLATGSGANIRYLVEKLPGSQEWLAIDGDSRLLSGIGPRMSAWAAHRRFTIVHAGNRLILERSPGICTIATRCSELSESVDAAGGGLFAGADLVTASALLDLVSERWLRTAAGRSAAAGASLLFALTYDGRIEWSPADRGDAMIRDLVNRHQLGDKGFGPALGPGAVDAAERCLAEAGYEVQRARSDWRLGSEHDELQRALMDGWAAAARAMLPSAAQDIDGWRARRLVHVADRRSSILVGHEDVVGMLRPVR